MVNKIIKSDRYFFIVCLSLILGLTRYYLYDNSNFNLFLLVDKNKKEIKVDLGYLAKVKKNVDLVNALNKDGLNKEISFDEAYFLHTNDLSFFIDARDQDEIAKEGQIPNSLIIPVSNIKLVIEGKRNEADECVNYDGWDFVSEKICGYDDVLDLDFELDAERIEWAEDDFPIEMKVISMLKQLDKTVPYIVYCGSSDCDKSEDLYGYMTEYLSFEKVQKFIGGWKDWKENEAARNDK